MFQKVLALGAHPDDVELGAGGTIAKFIEEKKDVHHVVFSHVEKSVPKGFPKDVLVVECKKASKALGISPEKLVFFDYEVRQFPLHRQAVLEDMIKLGQKIKPDLVLVPSSTDTHQDHQVVHKEALRAFKKTSAILGYEHPWNNLSFTTDVFVRLEQSHILKKAKAISLYESQKFRFNFNEGYILALAKTRGMQIDVPFVEAFELIRLII